MADPLRIVEQLIVLDRLRTFRALMESATGDPEYPHYVAGFPNSCKYDDFHKVLICPISQCQLNESDGDDHSLWLADDCSIACYGEWKTIGENYVCVDDPTDPTFPRSSCCAYKTTGGLLQCSWDYPYDPSPSTCRSELPDPGGGVYFCKCSHETKCLTQTAVPSDPNVVRCDRV